MEQLMGSINNSLRVLGKDSLSDDLLVVLDSTDLSKMQIYNLRKEEKKLAQMCLCRRKELDAVTSDIRTLAKELGPHTLHHNHHQQQQQQQQQSQEEAAAAAATFLLDDVSGDASMTSSKLFCALEVREALAEVKAQREAQVKRLTCEIRRLYAEVTGGKEADMSVIVSAENPLYEANIEACRCELERLRAIKKQNNLQKIKELDAELSDILEQIGPCRAAGDKASLMSSVYSGDVNAFSYAEIENVIELYRDVIDSRREILKEKTRLCTQIERFIKLNALRQQFLTRGEDSRLMYSSTQPDIARKLRMMTAQKEAIRKNLPAIERDIKASLGSWKEMYGDDFLYNGKDNYALIIDAEERAYTRMLDEHKRREQQKRVEKNSSSSASLNFTATSTNMSCSTFGVSNSFACGSAALTSPATQPVQVVVQTPKRVVKKVVVVGGVGGGIGTGTGTGHKGRTPATPAQTPSSTVKTKTPKTAAIGTNAAVGTTGKAVGKRRKNVISPIPKKLNASCK